MWAKNQVGVVWATCRRHVVKKEVGVRWATCGRTARWALCGRHVGDMQSFFIQKTDGLSTCRQHVGVRWGTNLLCRRHVGDMQAFSPFRLHFRQHHVSEGEFPKQQFSFVKVTTYIENRFFNPNSSFWSCMVEYSFVFSVEFQDCRKVVKPIIYQI